MADDRRRLAVIRQKIEHQQRDAAIEGTVTMRHLTGVADVELRALAACPQPTSS
jgi:hypothetical protein